MTTTVDTLVAAFADDPLYQWLYATDVRTRALHDNMRLIVDLAHERGRIDTIGNGVGVAIWTPPGVTLLDDPTPFVDLLRRWAPNRLEAALAGMATCAAYEPNGSAVLHLIGIHPDARNIGLGSRLVAPILTFADHAVCPVHLQSSNIRNVPFYERHHFRTDAAVTVPDGGPTMRPMTRHPRTTSRPDRPGPHTE